MMPAVIIVEISNDFLEMNRQDALESAFMLTPGSRTAIRTEARGYNGQYLDKCPKRHATSANTIQDP